MTIVSPNFKIDATSTGIAGLPDQKILVVGVKDASGTAADLVVQENVQSEN